MNDIFVEKLVGKRPTAVDWAKLVGVYLAAMAVAAAAFYIEFFVTMGLEPILLPVLAGAVFGSYSLAKLLGVEYEAIYTNGALDVDIIRGRARRKRLFSCEIREAEDFGKYVPGLDFPGCKALYACDSAKSDDLWFFTAQNRSGGGAKTAVILNMGERELAATRPYLKPGLARQIPAIPNVSGQAS